MNHLLIFLSGVALCGANNFVCQFFDEKTNSLEKYCENFQSTVPINCEREIDAIESSQVEQLKIGGCDSVTVLDSIERFKSVRSLDIAYSRYRTLDWLDLNVIRLEKLNSSHNDLTSVKISQQNATDLAMIDLSYNQLRYLPLDTFKGVSQLIKLDLSHNAIHSIDGDVFSDAINLEFLYLNGNRFWTIPIITKNKRLKAISLTDNPILTFDCSKISMMSEISLFLSWKSTISFHGDGHCEQKPMRIVRDYHNEGVLMIDDGMHELHCNEQSFENLTIFVAGRNSFSNANDLLPCLNPTVMHIDLSGNYIGNLHAAIFHRFNHLVALSLADTQLTDFSFAMTKSDKLMKIDVSNNNLKFLRNVRLLEGFDSLEELSVAGNEIENIQDLIQHLKPAITKLNLSRNKLGPVNAITFEWLTEMKSLNLSNTTLSITDFKPFEPLKNLSILDISNNNLSNVNFTMLSMLKQLNHLSLAHCHISNASDIIRNLQPSLRTLDLSGNPLVDNELKFQTFSMLTNLYSLNLSNTNLSSINLNAFDMLRNLHILDISKNKLRKLHFQEITNHLNHLYLAGNEIIEIENFDQVYFPQLKSLEIAKNQLPCKYLRRLKSEWIALNFIGDLFDQKHGKNCQSTIQTISDFFRSLF